MAEDGRILIKHAASTSLAKMMDLIIRLMEAGVLIRAEDCPPDVGDTMLAFYPGQAAAVSSELLISSWLDIFDSHLSQTLTHCPAAQLVPPPQLVELKNGETYNHGINAGLWIPSRPDGNESVATYGS